MEFWLIMPAFSINPLNAEYNLYWMRCVPTTLILLCYSIMTAFIASMNFALKGISPSYMKYFWIIFNFGFVLSAMTILLLNTHMPSIHCLFSLVSVIYFAIIGYCSYGLLRISSAASKRIISRFSYVIVLIEFSLLSIGIFQMVQFFRSTNFDRLVVLFCCVHAQCCCSSFYDESALELFINCGIELLPAATLIALMSNTFATVENRLNITATAISTGPKSSIVNPFATTASTSKVYYQTAVNLDEL